MPINPTSLTIEPGQTQLFTQSGITSPVWTLEGAGSLNQSGFYTAPGVAGAALVRVHGSFWNYVNSAYFTANVDDTLTKNTSTAGYFMQAKSNGTLNAVGDFVEFVVARTNPYWTGIENDATTYRLVYYAGGNPNFLTIYHPSGNSFIAIPTWNVNDVIKLEIISGGFVRVSQNGTVVHTTTQVFSGQNVRFITDADLSNGTIIKVPRLSSGNYTEFQASVTITPPLLTTKTGLEIYCQSDTLGLANNAPVTSFTDLSGKGRHLTAKTSDYPLFKTAGNYIQFNGTDSSLLGTSNIPITVVCGFMVAKYDDAAFPNTADGYKGLLTDLTTYDILVGNANTDKFFDFGYDLYEFRSDDRIYPDSNAPAPMQNWRLIFFRFSRSITLGGVQIAQQRNLSARKWKGGIKFLALFSSNMTESDIRKNAKSIADYYTITLADVYPFQADRRGLSETPIQSVNFYDPPEGERISEVWSDSKRSLDLKFSSRRSDERKAMKEFHASHYDQALPFIYRDYSDYPPEDIEGYFDSQYTLEGNLNNYNYAFRFREK